MKKNRPFLGFMSLIMYNGILNTAFATDLSSDEDDNQSQEKIEQSEPLVDKSHVIQDRFEALLIQNQNLLLENQKVLHYANSSVFGFEKEFLDILKKYAKDKNRLFKENINFLSGVDKSWIITIEQGSESKFFSIVEKQKDKIINPEEIKFFDPSIEYQFDNCKQLIKNSLEIMLKQQKDEISNFAGTFNYMTMMNFVKNIFDLRTFGAITLGYYLDIGSPYSLLGYCMLFSGLKALLTSIAYSIDSQFYRIFPLEDDHINDEASLIALYIVYRNRHDRLFDFNFYHSFQFFNSEKIDTREKDLITYSQKVFILLSRLFSKRYLTKEGYLTRKLPYDYQLYKKQLNLPSYNLIYLKEYDQLVRPTDLIAGSPA